MEEVISYRLLKEDKGPTGWFIEHLGKGNNETIHVDHTSWENIEDARNDIWGAYCIVEEFGNYPRLHLIEESSEELALQAIQEWMDREYDNPDYYHIITVLPLDV
jgi:hypothetical protein